MTANGRPGRSGPGPGSAEGPAGPAWPTEIRLTTEWVARAMGGTVRAGDPDREFNGVSIDTRTLVAGELFIAITGERFDGADFAGAAIDAGAGGIVVERRRGREPAEQKGVRPHLSGVAIIEVDDAIAALQALAQAIRRASVPKSWPSPAAPARPRRRK